MAIISHTDFMMATGTTGCPRLAALLMRSMKVDAFNDMMTAAGDLKGTDFVRFAMFFLEIEIDVDPNEVANIPTAGPFITVANHPYGAIESLALLDLLVTQRADTLFMGNFLLKRLPHLADHIIAVNPFETIRDSSSISGLKTVLSKLKAGTPVAIFPAGEVSGFDFRKFKVTDREWHPVVGKLIAKAKVPVLPIYFHGHNNVGFGLLRYIHPSLQTAMLPAELFNKKKKTLKITIGKLIAPSANPNLENSKILLARLREQTYSLRS